MRLQMRCAIHMGEVTVEGTDLLGDGINIVSRLQEHAPVGGVLVSAAVMDLISGRLDPADRGAGPLRLRNISRPVHAYAVGPGRTGVRRDGAGDRQLPAAPAVDRRAAVRRFLRRDGGRAAEAASSWLSDGLVEDIIAALSCLPELIVISRASVLRYRGAVPDPASIRRELNVRYMLTGSVRRAGARCGCRPSWPTARAAGRSGATASRARPRTCSCCRTSSSARVVATIAPRSRSRSCAACCASIPESLDAYECVLRGLDLLYRFEDDESEQALPLFQRAIALDPAYATAYALAATCYGERFYRGESPDPMATTRRPSG